VLIIFAVGNQGTLGKGTVASPASSKNCLAVCGFAATVDFATRVRRSFLGALRNGKE
jgi:hypothetical protein